MTQLSKHKTKQNKVVQWGQYGDKDRTPKVDCLDDKRNDETTLYIDKISTKRSSEKFVKLLPRRSKTNI